MMAVEPSNSWKQQDGVIVNEPEDPDREAHAQERWNERIRSRDELDNQAWVNYPVRTAWREADEMSVGDGAAYRIHRPTGMVIANRWGFLSTCWYEPQLHDRDEDEEGDDDE